MNEKAAVARIDAHAPGVRARPVPRRVLDAFDALALHDSRAADSLDGAGIEIALEWEWERAEHGIPEGISREDLVAMTEGSVTASGRDEGERDPDQEAHGGTGKEKEEAA